MDAQTVRDYVRRGNILMQDTLKGNESWEKAIVQYKKALELDSTSSIANYNLGVALCMNGENEAAVKRFLAAEKYEKDKQRQSDIYHNLGVLMQANKKYKEAVEFYKSSLRNDPSNDETRYNYVLALWQLKKQQEQEDKDKDDKDDKDKEKDEKKDEKKEQEDKQKNEDKQQKKENQQQQEQQQQPQQQIPKETAERLLKAAMRNEKETQEKIQRRQQETPKRRLQKQW